MLSNPERYEKICASCRERVEKNFSTDLMIKKLEEIFIDLVKNPEKIQARKKISEDLQQYSKLIDQFPILIAEIAAGDQMWKIMTIPAQEKPATKDQTYELMRIANSRWGRRLIKLFFKLRLNKFFK